MKVTNSFEKINPFGGINFILDEARKCGIPQLIDSLLGERGKGYTYKYSDIFTTMWSIFFCGGDCAEDINTHFGEYLRTIPGCLIPSADVILTGQKELADFRQFTISNAGIMHDVDINPKMSLSLLKLQKKLGLLKKNVGYTLDFDHTAMCRSFYKYLVEKLAKRNWFLPNIRIKKFIFGFITVASKWIYHSRMKILKIYTPKHYQPAFG